MNKAGNQSDKDSETRNNDQQDPVEMTRSLQEILSPEFKIIMHALVSYLVPKLKNSFFKP